MNAQDYKSKRKFLGYTQIELSALLGVNRVTIARRETVEAVITQEAWLALNALPKKRKKVQVMAVASKVLQHDFGSKKGS